VFAICWSAPVVDELNGHPGNLTLVFDSAATPKAKLGAGAGWHAVVRAVGVRPWWLHVPHDRWERKYDVRSQPGGRATTTCLFLLGALLAALIVALARRRRDVAAAALIGFVLCAALAAEAAATPVPRILSATLGYTMWWGTQVGMWVWLILAWSAWLGLAWLAERARLPAWLARLGGRARLPAGRMRLAGRTRLAGRARPRLRLQGRPAASLGVGLACLIGVAGTAAVGAAVAATEKPDEHLAIYRPLAELGRSLERAIPAGRTIQLEGRLDISALPIKPGLRYLMVRHGVRVLGRGSYLRLGGWYELYDRPYDDDVYVYDGVKPPAPRARLVDRVRYRDGWGAHVVSVWMTPGSRRRSAIAGT
jgi:hypothetical protein